MLLVALTGLLALLLWPHSPWRRGLQTSLQDFLSLFKPLRGRRHVIHDEPYLNRVLEAEFSERKPSVSQRSTRDSSSPDLNAGASIDERLEQPPEDPSL